MRAHHVVVSTKKEASGLTYTIPRICNGLESAGVNVTLHVTSAGDVVERKYTERIYNSWKTWNSIGISPAMNIALKELPSNGAQIIHNHSLWTMPNLYAGFIKKTDTTKFIFSPHGTLTEWAMNHSKWKKKLFWNLGQYKVLENADCFHATALSEYEDIRRLGFKQPIAVVNLGVDIPISSNRDNAPPYSLLFFARLHPKKGLDTLLKAWATLQSQFTDWQLWIAGPEDFPGYVSELNQLVDSLDAKRVTFLGPQFGEDKRALFEKSSLYILPTHSENFGITVAEALSYNIPAVVTEGAPWSGLKTHDCGWWVPNNLEAIKTALLEAMSLSPSERERKGANGRNWMKDEFSWEQVGERLRQMYEWTLAGSHKVDSPDFIHYD